MEALDLDSQSVDSLGTDVVQQVLLGHFMIDYWINLIVCHSLIVEDHPTLGKVYQVIIDSLAPHSSIPGDYRQFGSS